MNKVLKLTLLTAAMAMPLSASAGHCGKDKGYKDRGYMKHGYMGQPGYMRHSYPRHAHPMGMRKPAYKHGYKHGGMHGYKHGYKHGHMHPRSHPGAMSPRASEMQQQTQGGGEQASNESVQAEATATILDTAAGAGKFETLISAIKVAGLENTLQAEGPFTVFAPTDAAFDRIPDKILAALVADKDALTEVLTYHVVPGKVTAADVAKLESATTVQGSDVRIDTADGVRVGGANVVKADIQATNGIIHVVDQVMLPN